jgi:hypothetical protein
MQNPQNETLLFFLKFIFEMTIVQRDALAKGLNIEKKIFHLIHTASSLGKSGKSIDEFSKILHEYSENNPDLAKAVNFSLERAKH